MIRQFDSLLVWFVGKIAESARFFSCQVIRGTRLRDQGDQDLERVIDSYVTLWLFGIMMEIWCFWAFGVEDSSQHGRILTQI